MGIVFSNLGTVNLVSGEEVTLNISGDGSIQAAVTGEVLNNVYDQDGNIVNDLDGFIFDINLLLIHSLYLQLSQ